MTGRDGYVRHMRVSSRVALIACSASVIGAPSAAACSPQDYMSPEDWQALSPEQRAENVAHTHDAGDAATTPTTAPATPPAAPVQAPATRDAAPQLTEPSNGAGSRPAEPPPSKGTAPILPRLDGPSHRGPTADRRAATGTRRGERSPGPSSEAPRDATRAGVPESSAAVASARTTVVAVEQLTRMAAAAPAGERAAARRAERRASERAAGRRARSRTRGDTAAPANHVRADAQASGRIPVRADEAPVTSNSSSNDTARLTAWAALTLALAGFVALLLRRPRPEASAETTSGQVAPPTSDAVAADLVEAELQAIIAAQTAPAPRRSGAQDAGTGDESSTATNSA